MTKLVASDAMSQSQRLRRHAGKYHRLAHKSTVISKYSAKAEEFGKADLRKHAAHVAAWIAYGPKGKVPGADELELLTKFMGKLGGGPLPSRLREVLPIAQEALRSSPRPSDGVDEGWKRAEQELRRSLQKFRCCCRPMEEACAARVSKEAAQDIVVESDMSDNDPADVLHDHAFDDTDASDAGDDNAIIHVQADTAPPAHDQRLQLFSKMNEWGFLDEAQRLERLEQVEAIAKRSRRSLDQAELAEAINVVVAALSPPRRQRGQQEAEPEGVDSEGAEVPDCQKDRQLVGMQRRLRSLLLEALRTWRLRRFDCQAIEHVLEYVQGKISKFEDNVGEIQGAAAGQAWVGIKQAVGELLLRAEDGPSAPEAQSTDSATRRAKNAKNAGAFKGRLERQSGIQGISWSNRNSGWTVSRQEAGKQRQTAFPIAQLLKQGLTEEEAVEAALQKAKAYREELVCQGKMEPSKPSSSKAPQSLLRGVSYDEKNSSWRVRPMDPSLGVRLNGGFFKHQDEAEDRAREMAKKMGLPAERCVVPVQKLSELPRFAPLGSQKGIIWRVNEQCWYADGRFQGVRRTMRFRPKDGSEGEVKKAWLEAVEWYRKHRDEKSQP
ncbi:unnamed protein product [Symbiodinium natans]|uniref:Uncharacterized protein n=1 Tax=Symbiodinium natans TaxID=878477 RepID=A0A812Q1U2_9DINO|nr:unnamed protein product [Symbiodinium natans]